MKKLFILSLVSFLAFTMCAFAQEKVFFSNNPEIPTIMKEFYHGAKYYDVDFKEKFNTLEAIRLVPGESNFLGRISGNNIELNQDLEKYPNLMRVILFRQLGKFYGLKKEKSTKLTIMSERWELTPQYEFYAHNLRSRPWHREQFFELLAEEKPLAKEI